MDTNSTMGFRLSSQQEHIWCLQGDDQRCPYRVQCSLVLNGPVDADRLKQALQQVISRHEILRTIYRRQPGMKTPFQLISEVAAPGWETLDLSAFSKEAQQTKLDELFEQQKAHRWDLQHPPAVRVLLVTLRPDKCVMLLTLSALCGDAWTIKKLIAEVACSYGSGSSVGPKATMQYADLVEWQTELLESEDAKSGRNYWRDLWRNVDPASLTAVTLPFERKVKAPQFEPDSISIQLEPALLAVIDTITRRYDVSLADVLLACWQVLLWRITRRSDLIIGCRYDGRRYEELEDVLGPFARYLPLHSNLESEATFAHVLQQVKASAGQAYKWQEAFAWKHVQAIAGSEDAVFAPFCFETEPYAETITADGLSCSMSRLYTCLDRFKVKAVCTPTKDGLQIELQYDRALYGTSDMQRVAHQFAVLATSAAQDPETPLKHLQILTDAERQLLFVDWNKTTEEYPNGQCIHQLFESQVQCNPERVAVACGDCELSYRELNARSNQLAHYLRRQGIGPDALVGLCVERSEAMIVALLGILKAGGAYVPLNPDNPKLRLAQQMEETTALVAQEALLNRLPAFAGTVVCLDRDSGSLQQESPDNPLPIAGPEDLTYVIYTSGSTGVPKGVAVEHRNLVNYAQFICRKLGLHQTSGLHFATVSTLAADLGNTCIFPALISGGCLHVIPYEVAADAQAFAAYTRRHPLDVLKIVPSHLRALLDSSEGSVLLPRVFLVLGGEPLSPDLVGRVRQLGAECQIINHYGPTETTVGSLTFTVPKELHDWETATVPIGRPIANTEVYILDDNLQPAPIGTPGELYIGGAGLARGYLNRPELTQERFVSDPFSGQPGARLYKTGDLARYLLDGNVEFIGRADDQLKIRGFRVELGEVQTLLAGHFAVRQTVVLARGDNDGDKHLVAYIVPTSPTSPSTDQLRDFLRDRLPDYMIPQSFVMLGKMPLTSNGKVDRNALPLPDDERLRADRFVAPRNELEEKLAVLWSEILRIPSVGVHDDFFALGGHSLAATRVISRVQKDFAVEVPLRAMFQGPTIAQLSDAINLARTTAKSVQPAIIPVSREAFTVKRSSL